jgi:hypothetical protein
MVSKCKNCGVEYWESLSECPYCGIPNLRHADFERTVHNENAYERVMEHKKRNYDTRDN